MASSQVPIKFSERRIMEKVTVEVTIERDLGWRRAGFLLIRLGAKIIGSKSELIVKKTEAADGMEP